ncbi:MAG: hypothetical protein HFJ84_08345 [Clostridiales bacterium]|jgi:hypothetical protein|nr:hypothetical protein [Clostridiales bacterium]
MILRKGSGPPLKYCKACMILTDSKICPYCGRKKLPLAQSRDIVFLCRKGLFESGLLENAFEEKKILYQKVANQGAGITLQVGNILETFDFYILYQDFDLAQELLVTMFGPEE